MSKVAIVQIQSSTEKRENLRRALELVKDSKSGGADLVVFPEFLMAFSPASQTAKELAQVAEPLQGYFITTLKEAAKATRTAIVATIYETCSIPDRVYDSALWIDTERQYCGCLPQAALVRCLRFSRVRQICRWRRPDTAGDVGGWPLRHDDLL